MNYELRKRNKFSSFLAFTLIISFLIPFITLPKRAEAFLGIADFGFSFETNPALVISNPITAGATLADGPIKNFGLDSIAWIVVNIIIERVAASTVNWINNGFQGSPAFVTDPASYFKKIGDQVAGQVIYNHPDLQAMCSPFRLQVQVALNRNYAQPFGNYQCSLSQVIGNFDNFMSDFHDGGWNGFIQLTQNSQNNPLGLYNQLNNELNISLGNSTSRAETQLNWGQGFLSFKECAGGRLDAAAADEANAGIGVNIYEAGDCPAGQEKISTPGSVIEDQLNQTLQIGNNRLQVADEINEIISALLNQLTSKALGGLLSLGKGDSTDAQGRSYLDRLQTATENNDGEPYYNANNNDKIQQWTEEVNQNTSLLDGIGQATECAQSLTNLINSGTPPADTSSFGCISNTPAGSTPGGNNGGSGGNGNQPDYILIINGRTIDCRAPQNEPDYAACINAGKI